MAALVGSLVTIVLTPLSQTLIYYLTQALSRPILSIEYVETVLDEPAYKVDSHLFESLVKMPGYEEHARLNPQFNRIVYTYRTPLTPVQEKQLNSALESFKITINKRLDDVQVAKRSLENATSEEALIAEIQSFYGPLAGTISYINSPPAEMKVSFARQLENEITIQRNVLASIREIFYSLKPLSSSILGA
jgi:hypothetical protein